MMTKKCHTGKALNSFFLRAHYMQM